MNPTSPKRVKARGEGPLRPKDKTPPRHRDTLGQIRAPTARLASTWRGPDREQSVARLISFISCI